MITDKMVEAAYDKWWAERNENMELEDRIRHVLEAADAAREVPALQGALNDMVDAAQCLLNTCGVVRGKTPEDDDWFLHERDAENYLQETTDRIRTTFEVTP